MSPTTQFCAAAGRGWPLERVLFAVGGTLGLASAALSAFVSPRFLLLTAFVAANQLLYVAAGERPASIRLLLVPAILAITGRAAWWLPKPLARILPKIRFGH